MRSAAPPHIRWLLRRDLPAVLAIERASFEFPWTVEDFAQELTHPRALGLVAEQGERVIGFAVYQINRRSIRLINLAVAPAHRRRGVGRGLIEHIAAELDEVRRPRITLEIRERNLPGQLFFRACGFRAVKVLRDRWTEEDGYLMVLEARS